MPPRIDGDKLTLNERKVLRHFFGGNGDLTLSAAVGKVYHAKNPRCIASQLLRKTPFKAAFDEVLDNMGLTARALSLMGLRFLTATKKVYNVSAGRFDEIEDLQTQYRAWNDLVRMRGAFKEALPSKKTDEEIPKIGIGGQADPAQLQANMQEAKKFMPLNGGKSERNSGKIKVSGS